MEIGAGIETALDHRFAHAHGGIEKLLFAESAPGREQPADDDPGIEEVSDVLSVELKRYAARERIAGRD